MVILIEEVDVLYDMLKDSDFDMLKCVFWVINVECVCLKIIDDNEVFYFLDNI